MADDTMDIKWDDVWAEPSDDLYCQPIDVRVELREWEPTRDDDPGEGEYLTIEVEDLANPDREWNRTLTFKYPGSHRNSKLSLWKKDMGRIGHPIKTNADILNYAFHFKLKDLPKGNITYTNYPEPVRVFPSREACLAAITTVGESQEPTTKDEASPTLSKAEKAVLKHLDGKTWPQAVVTVFGDDAIKGDTALITILVDEAARTKLFEGWFESELLTQDEDGKYVAL